MELEKQIQADLASAMKAQQATRTAALRGIKSAAMLVKTSPKGTKELTDDDMIKIIGRLVKQRKESAEIYTQQGRPELAKVELAEAAIMETYLPKQLSEAEVEAELKKIIAETGASKPSDMGKVMGIATKRMAGQTSGKTISALVIHLLA